MSCYSAHLTSCGVYYTSMLHPSRANVKLSGRDATSIPWDMQGRNIVHLVCLTNKRVYCRAHILKRYEALPDDKKPFAAPARRRHVAKHDSMDKGKAKLQDEDHSDLDSESADSHEEMVSVLPDEPGQRPSASWGTEDSARARQNHSQTPAQNIYTPPPQPSLEWQR